MCEVDPFSRASGPFTSDDDRFLDWKRKQARAVADRGTDLTNPANEDTYNTHMTRRCVDAYVCYKELDVYGRCLIDNRLWDSDKMGNVMLPDQSTPMIERKCKLPFHNYTQCISSRDNQDTVVKTGMMNPNCRRTHESFIQCVQVHIREEEDEADRGRGGSAASHDHFNARIEDGCGRIYSKLVRCGLNHLWEEYWRAITNFGDQEEFKMFQLESTMGAKSEYQQHIGEVKREIQKEGLDINHVVAAATLPPRAHPPADVAVDTHDNRASTGWFGWLGFGKKKDTPSPAPANATPIHDNNAATQRAIARIYGGGVEDERQSPNA